MDDDVRNLYLAEISRLTSKLENTKRQCSEQREIISKLGGRFEAPPSEQGEDIMSEYSSSISTHEEQRPPSMDSDCYACDADGYLNCMCVLEIDQDEIPDVDKPRLRKLWLERNHMIECHCGAVWDGFAQCMCCTMGYCEEYENDVIQEETAKPPKKQNVAEIFPKKRKPPEGLTTEKELIEFMSRNSVLLRKKKFK